MTRWLTSMVLAAGLLAFGQAQAQQAVEVEGQKFEPTVALGGQTLNLNGVGLRKRAIFKVYVAGLYAGQKSTNAAAIVNDKGARRVSLRMLRDVDAQSFIDSFNEGLKNNTPEAQLNAMKPQVDALVGDAEVDRRSEEGRRHQLRLHAGRRHAHHGKRPAEGQPDSGRRLLRRRAAHLAGRQTGRRDAEEGNARRVTRA